MVRILPHRVVEQRTTAASDRLLRALCRISAVEWAASTDGEQGAIDDSWLRSPVAVSGASVFARLRHPLSAAVLEQELAKVAKQQAALAKALAASQARRQSASYGTKTPEEVGVGWRINRALPRFPFSRCSAAMRPQTTIGRRSWRRWSRRRPCTSN